MAPPFPDPGAAIDRRHRARTGLRQIAIGSGLLVVGLAVTWGTYAAARPGGRYTLAYGPIVFGLVELVRGLAGWWPNRESALPPARAIRPAASPRNPAPALAATAPVRGPVRPDAPAGVSPVVATANEAERRRIRLTATEVRQAERPASPWHRPSTFGRKEADPISLLRFAAHRCEIRAEGLRASYPDGTTRELPWAEIAQIAVRQLPPDPPWERSLVVDLAPAEGPPIRLLSTSFVNFAALPGGATASRLDNVRRLASLVREHNPGLQIESATEGFVASQGAPLRLLSMNQFAEYDARYG
jgi:hypothetical protein